MSDEPEKRTTYMGYVCDARDVEVTFEEPEADDLPSVRLVFRTYTGTFELHMSDRALASLAARVIVQMAGPDQSPRPTEERP